MSFSGNNGVVVKGEETDHLKVMGNRLVTLDRSLATGAEKLFPATTNCNIQFSAGKHLLTQNKT